MALSFTEPNVAPTGRYPVGVAAKLLGCHRNSLTKWADNGLIKYGVRRTGKHERFFEGAELLRFWRRKL